MHYLSKLRADSSLSAVVAGVIAVIVSYSGPSILVFQAAHLAGFSAGFTSSWLWAISVGSGLVGVVLSLRYRMPVIIAWSTPGAALLVTMLPGYSPAQAVAAFMTAALVIAAIGLSGAFDALMRKLPASIAAAMLAGILFRFGAEVFISLRTNPTLVLIMFATYLALRRIKPRYAILGVLLAGLLVAGVSGQIHLPQQALALSLPQWTSPAWSWHVVLNLGLPLALVGLSGQYVPGIAVMRSSGYDLASRPLVVSNAVVSLLLAPFGSHGVNPAAITAAICTGEEAHPAHDKRYIAGVVCGLFYLLASLGVGALALVFSALPKEWVICLCGLALFGAIANGLATAFANPEQREPALITFLLTASGMTFLGLGAAFWGIIAGMIAHAALHFRWKQRSLARLAEQES
jgi:benzoate membrane transport protein